MNRLNQLWKRVAGFAGVLLLVVQYLYASMATKFISRLRGRQAALALLLTWVSFSVLNLLVGLSFPSLSELHAPSFLRQAELIRIASGGRENRGSTTAGLSKRPKDEAWEQIVSETLKSSLKELDGVILPGAYGWQKEKDAQVAVVSSDTFKFDVYEDCKRLFEQVGAGFKNPYETLKSFTIIVQIDQSKTMFSVSLENGNWTAKSINSAEGETVRLEAAGLTLLDGTSLKFEPPALNKLCNGIKEQMTNAFIKYVTDLEDRPATAIESHFQYTIVKVSVVQPEASTPPPEIAEGDFQFYSISPAAKFNEKFPKYGPVVKLLHSVALGDKPEILRNDTTGLRELWGVPVPPDDSPLEIKPRYPISGDPPDAERSAPLRNVSIVWFNERDNHASPFVTVLSLENSWFWGQKLTCQYHLVDGVKMVSPSPEVERVLFWRGPWWLGWRPCGYDSTASQAATEFLSLYERTVGGRSQEKPTGLPSPQKLEQINRWIEGTIQDQIWFEKFREADRDLAELDPLGQPAVDTFTSVARRLNGSDGWGLIQAAIVVAFWYGAIALSLQADRRNECVTFSLEVMPLLGFLGTVLGISNALIGAGSILSENIADKQRVVSNMTHQLATAFDTTFVALCGSLLLILLIKVTEYRYPTTG